VDARAWLRLWSRCINEQDYNAARHLFDESVRAFGTFAHCVDGGLDQLVSDQWKEIWPYITNFEFDEVHVESSQDQSLQTITALWASLGLDPSGPPFRRSGRATIVLRRNEACELKAIHTHFSLTVGSIARVER
jgi:ketosteroid isomerase-like protein